MKVKLKEAKIVDSLIIWGELDYRGFASIGVKLPSDFTNLNIFKEIAPRTQVVWHRGELLLYFSINLNTVCPNRSIFNLTANQLLSFCRKTYDAARLQLESYIDKTSSLLGINLSPMTDEELYFQLATFLNEVEPNLTFDPSVCIFKSSIIDPTIKFGKSGFSLNNVYQNIIRVDKYSENYKEIFEVLEDFGVTINFTEKGSELLIRIISSSEESTAEHSIAVKEKIHSLPGTGYYESTSKQALVTDYQNSIPGWLWSKKQTFAKVIL